MVVLQDVKVLLIEDNEDSVAIINEMLEQAEFTKFDVTDVETLKEGIKFLSDCFFDVVLLDMILPNSAGIETFVQLNKHCPQVPVVIVSGFDDLGCEAVKRGAQDFLPKDELSTALIVRSLKYAIERKRLESEALNLKKMYQEIVESTHASIYEICFRTDRLTYVNDVLCNITGYSRHELMNMSISNLLTESSKTVWLQRYQALLDKKPISRTFEYEIRIKDGSKVWCLITASYKRDENDVPVGARVIALDITEKKMAQMEAQYKEELVYNELEKKLLTWRKESFVNRQFQERQLEAMDIRIVSMSNGMNQ